LYFLVGFACLPAWPAIARRLGKKQAWLLAMATSVAAFSGAAFLQYGQAWLYVLIVVASGVGFGAGVVLPASIVADTIDYDELRSGQRREGLYFGLWSVVTKASAAVGAALALPALEWAGYAANARQSESVLQMLRLLYAGVPCLCYAAAMIVAARFPIDQVCHTAIREGLMRRAQGLPAIDPLAERSPA
jgi:GPH family glycoside/pentoside/hexuronide:cation symporter